MSALHTTTGPSQSEQQLRLLSMAVDATDRCILILDEDRKITYTNHAFLDLFGYTEEEVLGKRPSQFLPGPGTDLSTLERLRNAAWENRAINEDTLLYSKAGRELWVSGSISPIHNDDGHVTNLVIVLVDVTKTKQIQAFQQDVLEAVASGLPLADVADFICRRVEIIAPEVRSTMLLVDRAGHLHPLANPSLPPSYAAALEGLLIGDHAGSCGTAAYLGKAVCVTDISSDSRWEDYRSMVLPLGLKACWASPIKMRDGHVAGTFTFYYMEKRGPSALHQELVAACLHLCALAIENHEAKLRIAQLTHFDTLTGLPNRTYFYEMADNLMAHPNGRGVAFFAIDIDHFKDVNNTLGYSSGDLTLIKIAYSLQKLANHQGIVSRIGGDDFMMVLPNCSATKASVVAGRILEIFNSPFQLSNSTLSISASVGISIAQDVNSSPQVLAEQAMVAKLQAKSTGRAAYHFYSPEMNEFAKDRLLLGTALRKAIAENTLHLEYQPKVRLKTHELIGVEALSRWFDPELGDIPPGKFIPLAEEIGQIEAIGMWALREACRQMAEWRRLGTPISNISVNLAPVHFLNSDLPAFVSGLLAEFHLPPDALTIEITESAMVNQNPQGLATTRALHEIGVTLSMDDFGTGFSSLAQLSHLPLKELKLDRCFIQDFESDPSARAVTTAIISMGKNLGMTVVSEGVENAKQEAWLSSLGCEVAQGYFYGSSMDAPRLEAWLSQRTQAQS